MLVILGALRLEIAGIENCLTDRRYSTLEQYSICKGKYNGKNVLLVLTGVGREKAEKAAHLVLKSYPVKLLVSLGFGGALHPDLVGGDIVLCSNIHCGSGEEARQKHVSHADIHSDLGRALTGGSVNFRSGDLVTVIKPAMNRQEKQELQRNFNADVVDMESYWIAAVAAEWQVPFLSVRTISDTLEDELLPMGRFIDIEGNIHISRAILYFLSHPGHLSLVIRLYRNFRKAAKKLNEVINRLVAIYE
jgi:adenosylhomocysteine nucleosidase